MRGKNLGIIIALALSAASALIYEVVVTDVLFFYFIESTYSLATVLSVFLFGLGAGSLLIYYFSPKIKNKKLFFGFLQVAIALYVFFVLSNIKDIVAKISTLGTFVTSFAVLLIPTLFLGAIFPIAGAIFKKEKKDIIGLVYSSDLSGAIIGSLVAGFFLIPVYGAKFTIFFGGFLNIFSAFLIFPRKYKLIPIILAVLLVIASISGVFAIEEREHEFYSPSPYGVVELRDNLTSLWINEREQCALTYPEDTSERKMADYAIEPLQGEDEEKEKLRVLNIGLGCGLTLEQALKHDTEVDVVEINPKVVMANRLMTDVLKDERVNLIVDDGLKYLRESDKEYDIILIDIENPLIAHSSNLYTTDAFEIINNSLSDKGTFALFSYDDETSQKYSDVLYYSLSEHFDYVYQNFGFFLASKQKLDYEEYVPKTEYEINSIDKQVLQKYINPSLLMD